MKIMMVNHCQGGVGTGVARGALGVIGPPNFVKAITK